MNLKCIVVDDEALARKYLIDYISKVPFLELLGDFNSPIKAYELIEKGEVDLIFLDIQMPEISGIDFLKTLEKKPAVILTTAYLDYALEGYELDIIDYLLKPISFQRFLKAVHKVSALNPMPKTESEAPSENQNLNNIEDYILVKADRKHYKINYKDIKYIEGQKAYVTFYCEGGKNITAIYSLIDLEDQLPSTHFIRVHKSYIVSVQHISLFQAHQIEIKGKQIPIGKSYKSKVYDFFKATE
jgi:DNA-binding LytR/AlgR family response regulator